MLHIMGNYEYQTYYGEMIVWNSLIEYKNKRYIKITYNGKLYYIIDKNLSKLKNKDSFKYLISATFYEDGQILPFQTTVFVATNNITLTLPKNKSIILGKYFDVILINEVSCGNVTGSIIDNNKKNIITIEGKHNSYSFIPTKEGWYSI